MVKKVLRYCIIFSLLIVITGCGKDRNPNSVATVPPTSTDNQSTGKNCEEIEAGDYSSLLGVWEQVAYAMNFYDGEGINWRGESYNIGPATLSVTSDKTAMSKTAVIILEIHSRIKMVPIILPLKP